MVKIVSADSEGATLHQPGPRRTFVFAGGFGGERPHIEAVTTSPARDAHLAPEVVARRAVITGIGQEVLQDASLRVRTAQLQQASLDITKAPEPATPAAPKTTFKPETPGT